MLSFPGLLLMGELINSEKSFLVLFSVEFCNYWKLFHHLLPGYEGCD